MPVGVAMATAGRAACEVFKAAKLEVGVGRASASEGEVGGCVLQWCRGAWAFGRRRAPASTVRPERRLGAGVFLRLGKAASLPQSRRHWDFRGAVGEGQTFATTSHPWADHRGPSSYLCEALLVD